MKRSFTRYFFVAVIAFSLLSCPNPALNRMFEKDTPPIVPPTPTSYTVTFNSQGGSTVSAQGVTFGGMATAPSAPTWGGYIFGGWYTALTGGSKYSFSSAVTGNLTLYARWSNTADDMADFGGAPDEIFAAGSQADWEAAQTAIAAGGPNKDYVIDVDSTFNGNFGGQTFGSDTGVTVSIRGSGEMYRNAGTSGSVLIVNASQTFILRGPTIRGWSGMTVPLVFVLSGGTFIMESGFITNNGNTGVTIYPSGTFTINGIPSTHTSMVYSNGPPDVQNFGIVNGSTGATAGW